MFLNIILTDRILTQKQDHIILSIVSGVILFVLFIVLPVFGYFVIVKKTAGANMLHALQVPYKQQYAFWALVEFAERILIAIVSVATVSYATYAWAMFVTVLTFLFLQRYNAYKNDEVNGGGGGGGGVLK